MGPSFSLEYYDRIFGPRSAAYGELLEALRAELAEYSGSLAAALQAGDRDALSRLRHAHRPLIENLRLSRLRTLEDSIRAALESGRPRPELTGLSTLFQDEAEAVASALTSVRFPDGPGLP